MSGFAARAQSCAALEGVWVLFFGESRVMACTRLELERWLRELIPGELVVGPDRFEFEVDGVPITVEVTTRPARRIGVLDIPLLELRFGFPGTARTAAHAWIARFDRHTLRGGG